MANALYDFGRNEFAKGNINWLASGGSDVRAMLIDSAVYTADLANHDYLNDVAVGSRAGDNGGTSGSDGADMTLIDPTAGVCDANDTTIVAVPSGTEYEYILLYIWTGDEATSTLIALIDTATGLPITSNDGDIVIQWDNGANKIFKL